MYKNNIAWFPKNKPEILAMNFWENPQRQIPKWGRRMGGQRLSRLFPENNLFWIVHASLIFYMTSLWIFAKKDWINRSQHLLSFLMQIWVKLSKDVVQVLRIGGWREIEILEVLCSSRQCLLKDFMSASFNERIHANFAKLITFVWPPTNI